MVSFLSIDSIWWWRDHFKLIWYHFSSSLRSFKRTYLTCDSYRMFMTDRSTALLLICLILSMVSLITINHTTDADNIQQWLCRKNQTSNKLAKKGRKNYRIRIRSCSCPMFRFFFFFLLMLLLFLLLCYFIVFAFNLLLLLLVFLFNFFYSLLLLLFFVSFSSHHFILFYS